MVSTYVNYHEPSLARARMLTGRILVRRRRAHESKTPAGIIIPASCFEVPDAAEVRAVGHTGNYPSSMRRGRTTALEAPCWLGDTVYIPRYLKAYDSDKDWDYIVLRFDEVLAVVLDEKNS